MQGRAVGATDEFHDGVEAGHGGELDGVVHPFDAVQRQAAVSGAVAGANGGDGDGLAGACGDQGGVVVQQADDARADGAEAGDADVHSGGGPGDVAS